MRLAERTDWEAPGKGRGGWTWKHRDVIVESEPDGAMITTKERDGGRMCRVLTWPQEKGISAILLSSERQLSPSVP